MIYEQHRILTNLNTKKSTINKSAHSYENNNTHQTPRGTFKTAFPIHIKMSNKIYLLTASEKKMLCRSFLPAM